MLDSPVRSSFRFSRYLLLAWLLLTGAFAQTALAAGGSPQAPRILVLGDSISAEYGLMRGTGWVQLLQNKLSDSGMDYALVNASISGETTSGGLVRLPALLEEHEPTIVIIELGANDALRGLQLGMTEANLREMVQLSKQAGAEVMVVGMQIPPNYGRIYAERFHTIFGLVASDEDAALVPFLLEGMAADLNFFQADRIHPNENAQSVLLGNVWPVLQALL